MKQLMEKIDGSLAVDNWQRKTRWLYFFELEEQQLFYEVGFEQDEIDTIEIAFTVESQSEDKRPTHEQIPVGMKGAIQVFHTVWVIIQDFIKTSDDPISIVEFSAKKSEPSRVKFYKTLAFQLAETYGYDKSDVEIIDGRYAQDEMYFMVPVGIE